MINIDSALDKAHVYHDMSGLQSLRSASASKGEKVEAAARQFESMMLNMMLKSMRQANEVFASGNMLHSNSTRFYEDMLHQQLSLTMARGEGLGLAKMLAEQLNSREPQGSVADPDDLSALPRQPLQNLPNAASGADRLIKDSLGADELEVLQRVQAIVEDSPAIRAATKAGTETKESPTTDVARVTEPLQFDSPQNFVESLLPAARQVAHQLGVEPELLIAQAALETGWGQHMISQNGEPSYNLFGIKADSRWQGPVSNVMTSEFRGGIKLSEQAQFRSYSSYNDSFEDYLKFLQSNDRYQQALASYADPEAFAEQLQSAGYATDPDYAAKILRIYRQLADEAPVTGKTAASTDQSGNRALPPEGR